MTIKHDAVVKELERLAKANGGLLEPEQVVEAARAKTSPLHSSFDWKDTEAAHKWRLHQARNLIRVTVEYLGPDEDASPSRVFVSLTPDRKEGGYRTMASVLSDAELRNQLMADALEDMKRFQLRYSALRELADVFAAMKKVGRGK